MSVSVCECWFLPVIPITATQPPPASGRLPFSFYCSQGKKVTLSRGLMFLQAPQFIGLSDPFQLYLAAAPKLAVARRVAGWFTPWKMRS